MSAVGKFFAGGALAGLLAGAAACGDSGSVAPSASVSVAPPAPCHEVPFADALGRCKAGEAKCCDTVTQTSDKKAADHLDNLAVACGGGTETACQFVRDTPRDPKWKLDALDRACTRIGRWTCRAAVQLALVHDFERAPTVFENMCRQTNDPEIQLAGKSFKCPSFAKSGLESLKEEAGRCRDGGLASCKRIADVDSAGKKLLMEATWIRRGVDPVAASEAWLMPSVAADVKPGGNVSYSSPDAFDGAIRSLEPTKEGVRRCIGQRLEIDEKPKGEATLKLTIDKDAKVAFTAVESEGDLNPRLLACMRAELQDGEATGVKPGSTLTLVVKVR